jgi:hypothetical protein
VSTVGAYTGITFDFGYISKDMGNGHGFQPYDCVVECNDHTLLEIYEYLKYVTRSGSTETLNGVIGEYYTGCGDVRFAYDNEAVGTFVEGELVTGTGETYGHLVSLLDNGTTGTMVLRNVHGTFTDNMSLTGATNGATALVNGTVTSITPQKQAPFGSFAGGTFFGARGVWLDHVAAADANNYQLIDSLGVTQNPSTSIAITVNGLVSGDKVSMFRTLGNTEVIDKSVYTSHASSNTADLGTFTVTTTIDTDTPTSGTLRVVDRSSSGLIVSEHVYSYSSWSGSTFYLDGETLVQTYDSYDTAYVPYIDQEATGTTASVNIKYSTDRYVVTRVRKKGIIPFTVQGQITSSNLTVTVIRTDDTIFNPTS